MSDENLTRDAWEDEARRIVRAELARQDVTYKQLVKLLGGIGVDETERSITNKLSRGSFQFVFALQVMAALGVKVLDVQLRGAGKKV